MRIALATQRDLPAWEVDDRPLFTALEARGVELVHPAWDDPDFDWGSCAGVLIRTTWDYMVSRERRAAFVSWAERTAGVTKLLNPAEVVEWNTHKSYLHDLQRLGAPVTPTAWLTRGRAVDVAALCEERRWARAFAKPMVGSTARETLRFAADPAGAREGQQHLDRLLQHEDMMLQPYFDSVETLGELSLIVIDGSATHGVRKVPVDGDYRVQDDFGAHDEPFEFAAEEARLAQEIVTLAERQLGLDGALLYARVDFLRDDDGRLNLNELELVEPSMFFRHAPAAAERLADALIARVT